MKKILIIALVFISLKSFAQEYPQEIKPGQSKNVSTTTDTLWVIKNSQFNRALKSGMELDVCHEKEKTLNQIIEKKDLVISKKDSSLNDIKTGYDRYKTKWEESDKKLETAEKDIVILKTKVKKAAVYSAITGILLTSLFFLLR
jgi:hypothetical protein